MTCEVCVDDISITTQLPQDISSTYSHVRDVLYRHFHVQLITTQAASELGCEKFHNVAVKPSCATATFRLLHPPKIFESCKGPVSRSGSRFEFHSLLQCPFS